MIWHCKSNNMTYISACMSVVRGLCFGSLLYIVCGNKALPGSHQPRNLERSSNGSLLVSQR
jgi:hypothetical protein